MSKATVYFMPVANGESAASLARKTATLCETAFPEVVRDGDLMAVKQHFGERDNTGYIKPEVTAEVCRFVKAKGGRPFVTDTNTLYRGRRSNTVDHLEMAREHGFTHESLGAPVVIADGLVGADQVLVPIEGGKHFTEVRLASAGYQAAGAIVVTHCKGHCNAGFGGSIKNVGMGFAARAGKLAQHDAGCPEFDHDKCTACGLCVKWCPADAIELREKATLLADRCIGCGECLALCPFNAIGFHWSIDGPVLIERICEHALGFVSGKRGRCGYLNYVIDLTRDCDCMGHKQTPDYPDVGIVAGTDLVAVDKAAADLANARCGKDIWSAWWPESDYSAQFTYSERLGVGTCDYEVVEVAAP